MFRGAEVDMSARTSFLARLIGLFLIAMGLPMALNKPAMVTTLASVVHDPALLLTFGMITHGVIAGAVRPDAGHETEGWVVVPR